MHLPGFTAELALRNVDRPYQDAGSSSAHQRGEGVVMPALTACQLQCRWDAAAPRRGTLPVDEHSFTGRASNLASKQFVRSSYAGCPTHRAFCDEWDAFGGVLQSVVGE
jgi:hypothetical protein